MDNMHNPDLLMNQLVIFLACYLTRLSRTQAKTLAPENRHFHPVQNCRSSRQLPVYICLTNKINFNHKCYS